MNNLVYIVNIDTSTFPTDASLVHLRGALVRWSQGLGSSFFISPSQDLVVGSSYYNSKALPQLLHVLRCNSVAYVVREVTSEAFNVL